MGHWKNTGSGVYSVPLSTKTDQLFFIKLGKGNNCFSREITQHKAGSPEIYWDSVDFLDHPRFTAEDGQSRKIKMAGLDGHRFFIKGSRALLDAEHEWYYDSEKKELLLIPPGKMIPSRGDVTVKSRVYGFRAKSLEHLRLEGLEFFACSVHFEQVRDVMLDKCRFFFPYELHKFHDNVQVVEDQHPVYPTGERPALDWVSS